MTLVERWQAKYKDVMDFVETNHRNPSRHRIYEHYYLNWFKANRKKMNAGGVKPDRVEAFNKLLEKIEEYKRVNQWK